MFNIVYSNTKVNFIVTRIEYLKRLQNTCVYHIGHNKRAFLQLHAHVFSLYYCT